ncbi:S1C family serine protease [Geothermobacter hydrogeniphilus]|nr:serine protease [Geothermobacter hydrogeniphilus]
MPHLFFRSLVCALLILLATATAGLAGSRINRSGYIAISIDPILYESNLWETSHRITLDKFFTAEAADLGEALAEGLEKTAFRGQLRVLPGYKADEQEEFRTNGSPDTFLITVDIRSRYGLTKSSPAAACLSGISCFLLSPINMFTYESKTEANVTAFYFTPAGKRLRLVQDHFTSEGQMSGDFYDAMNMSQELEWITELTRRAIDDLKRQILAEVPTDLVSRSWRKAADDLNRPPAGETARPGLPPVPRLARTRIKLSETETGHRPGSAAPQASLNLQQILRKVSPSIFKVITERGTGSGFAISSRGFGVTSLHVVDKAGKLRIRFHSGKEQPARVVARHPDLDLAILSFRAESARAIPLGDSLKSVPGDKVIAIGYPLDVGLSITPATIAALKKYRGLPLIYIDTLVPPGNSGGPLVNNQGRVIGITFRKQQQSDKKGTTLALPINEARKKFEPFLEFSDPG